MNKGAAGIHWHVSTLIKYGGLIAKLFPEKFRNIDLFCLKATTQPIFVHMKRVGCLVICVEAETVFSSELCTKTETTNEREQCGNKIAHSIAVISQNVFYSYTRTNQHKRIT